jgi:predicted metalloprotease with PDZ domain
MMKRLLSTRSLAVLIALAIAAPAFGAGTMTVTVDATDAHRGVFHSHLTIPATAGPMTFVYPKWIPGEHMPTGPLMQVAGLHVHAGDRELEWSRDRVEMFSFHVDVPSGAAAIEVDFDYLSPSATFGGGYGESSNATQKLLLILFNQLVVYPSGIPTDSLLCRASVRLPAGWKFDSALPVSRQEGSRVEFDPVSLTTLVDSPIVAGLHLRTIPIADDGREHITIVADSAAALAMPESRIAQVRNLLAESDALFGARHYRSYRWLLTLSDLVEPQGLEHHESTDIRAVEKGMTDPDSTARTITVLSHEFVHSWNGKYRRPAGLATPDYQQPMIGELLFVYEGMTRYLGDLLLSARSGMRTAEEDREFAAWVAANQDRNRPGRNSRPLVDTAVGVAALGAAPSEEVPYRRALDYYDESMLVWLDVDTTIRTRSGGSRSLDDFARIFFGPPSGAPMVKPYTLDDLASALNQVVPYDWKSFIEARVYRVTAHPPLGALEAAGWRLVYDEKPNWYQSLRERTTKQTDASFTLGMWVKQDGTIADVVYQSPAYAAGLMPGMKITGIDGRKFTDEVLVQEIDAAAGSSTPIDLAVEQGSFAGVFHVDYHGGRRFPHLQRIEGKADLLTDIMRPHAAR